MKCFKTLSLNATAGLLLMLALILPQIAQAQAPTLGSYPSTSVVAGQHTTITPLAAPTNTVRTVAFALNFAGVLSVNPTTGVMTVTNAERAGTFTTKVWAYGPGGSTSTTFQLTVTQPGCSQGQFVDSPSNYVTGLTTPEASAVADFNRDGIQDLAIANSGANNVVIRLGVGNGTFTNGVNVAVDLWPNRIVADDFNGDGNQDFAVAHRNSSIIAIRLGDGVGGFTASPNLSCRTLANQPTRAETFAVLDLNADGKKDIVWGSNDYQRMGIFVGDGTGNFSVPANSTIGASEIPLGIAIGDFNEDGFPDIAAANGSALGSVRYGNGTATLTSQQTLPTQSSTSGVTVADFNSDGHEDLAFTSLGQASGGRVSIFLGNGSGQFTTMPLVIVGSDPVKITVGDFNGDGKQDFVTSNRFDFNVSIGLGNGSGGFPSVSQIATGQQTLSTAVADFNGDARQDIAVAVQTNGTVKVLLGGTNEIDVRGNAVSIADGDITPSTADHTDFGVVPTNTPSPRTYTLANTGNTPLTIPVGGITIAGTNASMFVLSGITLPATIAAGAYQTFTVTFTPTSTGAKTATVTLANNDCDEAPYDFVLRGGQICDFSTCVGNTLTFTATSTGTTYAWSFGDASTSTAQNPTHSFTTAGTYTVTFQLTDGNGCITSTTQVVCVYEAPEVTAMNVNPLCAGASNGAIDISVTGGAPSTTFTYAWSSGATTQDVSGLAAGTYTVTVTDLTTTCFQVLSATLTDPAMLSATASVGTNVLCFGATTGTASVSASGGTTPYAFAWSNGQTTSNASGLAAGNYTVTVTDAHACTTTASVSISQPAAPLAATETHVNVLCFGNTTGSVNLSVTGGTSAYTYLWSNGATTEDLSGLAAGTYTVTVTDANGCTTTSSATLTQPTQLVVAPTNGGNVCAAGETASVFSNASGGTPTYTYLWTPGNATLQNLVNVGAGTYTVTVTDANGCTASGSTTVGTFASTPATFIIGQ